jgi:hypothetical protein
MMTETTTTDLAETKLTGVETEHAKLLSHLDDLRAEAQKARTTFEREPTAQAHGLLVVAEQRVKNQELAVDKHATETLEPAKAEALKVRFAKRRAEFERDYPAAAVDAYVARMANIVLAARKELGAAADELHALLLARREKRGDASACGFFMPQIRFDSIVGEANEVLARAIPNAHERGATLTNHSQGNASTLRIEVLVPIQINAYVR